MAQLLRLPEIAAGMDGAVLQAWPIAENTPFAAADPIATVETDKAVVDVEAETDGVILKTLVDPGAEVHVGTPIALVGEQGERVGDLDALLAELGVTTAAEVPAPPEGPATPVAPQGNGSRERIFASPLARRLAGEAGLGLDEITGSGPNGRIRRADVDAAIAARAARAPAPQPAPETPSPAEPAAAAYTDLPHSRMRNAIAARLTESKQSTPHFYLRGSARIDKLLKLRARLNEGAHVRISVNDLVVKAAARAHQLVPAMNVIWTPAAIRSFPSADISVAIATDGGLVTPVLRAVEQRSVSAVAASVRDFAERARTGALRQEELQGGTLTVTNLGMFGTEEFAAIINPPQSAILAVGAARQEPVVRNGKLNVGTVLRVTLSVDHRPVDGVVAAEWMRAFTALLENPTRILA